MPSVKPWTFDLDGTLIDSKQVVHETYEELGVHVPIDGMWGLPWRLWLPDACGGIDEATVIHAEKTRRYLKKLANGDVPELPFASIARQLQADGTRVDIITGATPAAAHAAVEMLGLKSDTLFAAGIPIRERAPLLNQIAPVGVYVDDLLEGNYSAVRAGWHFVWAKPIPKEVTWTP
jgi:phosphoglycolate phosphatase-like HAD superfamily hydrolase